MNNNSFTDVLVYNHSTLAAAIRDRVDRVGVEIVPILNWNHQIWKLYNIQDNQLLVRMLAVIGNFKGRIHV
jgi:hypothetical protein